MRVPSARLCQSPHHSLMANEQGTHKGCLYISIRLVLGLLSVADEGDDVVPFQVLARL